MLTPADDSAVPTRRAIAVIWAASEVLPHRLGPRERADEIGESLDTAALLVGHHHPGVVPGTLALQRREDLGHRRRRRRPEQEDAAVTGARGRCQRTDVRRLDRDRDRLVRQLRRRPGRDDLCRAREVRGGRPRLARARARR